MQNCFQELKKWPSIKKPAKYQSHIKFVKLSQIRLRTSLFN